MSMDTNRSNPHETPADFSAMFQLSNAQVMITGGSFTNVTNIGPSIDYVEVIEKYFKGHIAADATHDTYELADPPQCHPGTRTTILQKLMEWARKRDNASFISWVFGPAGVGKSAIGRSLAELLVADGLLGASFFFFRTADKRNTEKFLVSTIAYQLAYSFPESQPYIAAAVKRNPLVLQQSVGSQFQKLVIEPICSISSQDSQKAVIIDGLDECQDRDAQRLIITTICKAAPRLAGRLRFLILSRPEHHIESTFHHPVLNSIILSTDLKTDITAFDDILLFLLAKFDEIKRTHPLKSKIDPSWPGEKTVGILVWKSSGNFIYPQTVMKYIETDYDRPENRLKVILGLSRSSDTPFAELDDLYLHILSRARTQRTSLLRLLRALLACKSNMETSEFTFTTSFMETTLSMEPGDARLVLIDLQSLIAFDSDPECDTHTFPQLMHTSFSDFLLDRSRSKEYWIDLEQGYLDIAIGTLMTLQTRNITTARTRCLCNLDNSMSVYTLQSYYDVFFWCYDKSPIASRDTLQVAVLAHDSGRLYRLLLSDDLDDDQWFDIGTALPFFLRQLELSKFSIDSFPRHLLNFDALVKAFLDKYYDEGGALLDVCLTLLSCFSSFSPARIDYRTSMCIALICLFHPQQSIFPQKERLELLCKAIAKDGTEHGRRNLIAIAVVEAAESKKTRGTKPLKFLAKALAPFIIDHTSWRRNDSVRQDPVLKMYPLIAPFDSLLWNFPMQFLATFLTDPNRSGPYYTDDQNLYRAFTHCLLTYISPKPSDGRMPLSTNGILAQEPFSTYFTGTLSRLVVLLLYKKIELSEIRYMTGMHIPRTEAIQFAKQLEMDLQLALIGIPQGSYANKVLQLLKDLVDSCRAISKLERPLETNPLTPCLVLPITWEPSHWAHTPPDRWGVPERWGIPDKWVIEPLGNVRYWAVLNQTGLDGW